MKIDPCSDESGYIRAANRRRLYHARRVGGCAPMPGVRCGAGVCPTLQTLLGIICSGDKPGFLRCHCHSTLTEKKVTKQRIARTEVPARKAFFIEPPFVRSAGVGPTSSSKVSKRTGFGTPPQSNQIPLKRPWKPFLSESDNHWTSYVVDHILFQC